MPLAACRLVTGPVFSRSHWGLGASASQEEGLTAGSATALEKPGPCPLKPVCPGPVPARSLLSLGWRPSAQSSPRWGHTKGPAYPKEALGTPVPLGEKATGSQSCSHTGCRLSQNGALHGSSPV